MDHSFPTSESPRYSSDAQSSDEASFELVPVRARHDGWTPEKQHDFIAALAESGCVAEACAAVRLSAKSAYRLRARPDASTFRQAWDVALDYAIRRLGDFALSRALHGVSRPVFYQGEQIGERRHYDERLTMFLLRYRDPVRYGAWNDAMEANRARTARARRSPSVRSPPARRPPNASRCPITRAPRICASLPR